MFCYFSLIVRIERKRKKDGIKMNTKIFSKVFIVCVASILMITGCSSENNDSKGNGDQEPQNIQLQFATFWPGVDFQIEEGHKAWAKKISDRVAEETIHTVDFQWHFSGALLGPTEIFEGVADGAADLGSTCPQYTAGVFPLTMGYELYGFKHDNALTVSLAMQEAYETSTALQDEYKDVKVMFFWATGNGDLITNKPVRKLEDLKDLQIRTAGGSRLSISALQGTPVQLPMSEAYVSLDSGTVDGILGPTDILKGFRLAEVTKFVTKTPFIGYNVIFVKIMNIDKWNSLPESVQNIFNEVNEEFVSEYGKLRTDHTVIGLQYATDEFDHEIIELSKEEVARWEDLLKDIPGKWASDTEAAGLPGNEILNLFRELDEKYSNLYGDYGK